MNPLLADDPLPRFDAIEPAHVTPAIDRLLADAEAGLALSTSNAVPAELTALGCALDVPVERLQRAWSTIVHLHAVRDTPALREVFDANLPRLVEFTTRLAADPGLYAKTREIAESGAPFTPVQRKALADALRDFVLGGADLSGAARQRFGEIAERLATLSQRFGENVLDATDAWTLDVDETRLAGVPADVVARTRQAAADAGVTGCRLTLHGPCREPVLRHATDRALRETVLRAKAALCGDTGPADRDNGPLMQEIVALRAEQARLLGYADYATLSLATKMARDPAEVRDFLADLARRARPGAVAELTELRRFAADALGLSTLEPWDRDFAAERLKQQRHGIGDEQVRPYFPVPHVLQGCLQLLGELFDLRFVPVPDAPVWHPDVRVLRLERGRSVLGHLAIDLYARPGKQAGAWIDEATHRWRRPDDGALQWPLAHLVCNFPPPSERQPSLLTHDDLITLLHEFGHALHHLLTQVDELSLSGISGVEWDAAELPSQLMENFGWEWSVLQRLSAHVDTGEPLPRALFDRLRGARTFGSGLRLLRHLEYSLFDLRLHGAADAGRPVGAVAADVRREVALFHDPQGLGYPNSFTHVFDGGYAAGYYGYAWAEVLAADAYGAFEETGPFDAATGRRWRETVLETGGSRPAMDSFVAFRGREPRIDAFLRQHGLLEPQAALG